MMRPWFAAQGHRQSASSGRQRGDGRASEVPADIDDFEDEAETVVKLVGEGEERGQERVELRCRDDPPVEMGVKRDHAQIGTPERIGERLQSRARLDPFAELPGHGSGGTSTRMPTSGLLPRLRAGDAMRAISARELMLIRPMPACSAERIDSSDFAGPL
jgi:hypothetical protein